MAESNSTLPSLQISQAKLDLRELTRAPSKLRRKLPRRRAVDCPSRCLLSPSSALETAATWAFCAPDLKTLLLIHFPELRSAATGFSPNLVREKEPKSSECERLVSAVTTRSRSDLTCVSAPLQNAPVQFSPVEILSTRAYTCVHERVGCCSSSYRQLWLSR